MVDREKFKQDAKKYIQDIYASHRQQDEEAWENLINILFLYVDKLIEYYHPESGNDE